MNNQQDTHHEELIQESEVATIQNKCPGCGSNMFFDIESGGLRCRHCGTTKELDSNEQVQRRQITDDVLRSHKNWTEGKVFSCQNCGAKEVLETRAIASKCVFCGSGQIAQISELPGIRPDSVIPFSITDQTAEGNFGKWIKGKLLAPRTLRKRGASSHLTKMYTPVWSFSSRTVNQYNGTLGRTVTRTMPSRPGQPPRTVTETRWFRVNGMIHREYLDRMFQSGERIAPINFNRIKPFNITQLKVYRQEYLSGIIAEHYTKTLEQCFNEFSNFVRRDISNQILRNYRADRVGTLNINTQYLDRRFNYILLPIYISNYKYKNKQYNFYVNGDSGRVVGRYPKSGLKIFGIIAAVTAIIATVAVVAYFLM